MMIEIKDTRKLEEIRLGKRDWEVDNILRPMTFLFDFSRLTTTISSKKSQDKGKAIMIEEPVKSKKKDQIRFDEEAALKLQAKFDEEE
nr:hypothetical protein [Tanacetum cinerariifolium]